MICLLQATGRVNSATALADLRGDGGCPFYISAQIHGRGRNRSPISPCLLIQVENAVASEITKKRLGTEGTISKTVIHPGCFPIKRRKKRLTTVHIARSTSGAALRASVSASGGLSVDRDSAGVEP